MSYKEFWRLTWRQFFLYVDGYNKREINHWKRTREIVAIIYNTNSKRKRKASELIPLPTDKPIEHNKDWAVKQFREARRIAKEKKLNIPNKWLQ